MRVVMPEQGRVARISYWRRLRRLAAMVAPMNEAFVRSIEQFIAAEGIAHCPREGAAQGRHYKKAYNLTAADFGIVASDIRCELVPNELCQRYPLPPTGAQQLVCCCHRANATVERRYEIGNRATVRFWRKACLTKRVQQ